MRESVGDGDVLLNFEQEDELHPHYQSGNLLELYLEENEEDLLDVEYESEWEDLFTDVKQDNSPIDDDMLDMLESTHDGQCDEYDQITAACLEDEVYSDSEDMLEL